MELPNLQIKSLRLNRPAMRWLGPSLVSAVLSMAVLTLTLVVLVWPADDRLAQGQAGYERAKKRQDDLYAKRILSERVCAAQGHLDKVWEALPSQDRYAALAMAISELGKMEHVAIPGMSYHVDKAEGRLPAKATLTFKVTGEYAAIYRFIHRLETSQSYLVIESLDAARADKVAHAASHLVVFNMTVATFLQPAPPTREMS